MKNRQRTSSRHGILKAEAVRELAGVLIDAHVMVPSDIAALTVKQRADLRGRWIAVTGQRSGLSWDYLLMLAGGEGVKADRMVRRFVADALGRTANEVSQDQAHALVIEAAGRLGVGVSQLDFAMWLYQSGNAPA